MESHDETLDQIAAYLRGHKVPTRSQDIRAWADYLDQVVKPQLAAKPKAGGTAGKQAK